MTSPTRSSRTSDSPALSPAHGRAPADSPDHFRHSYSKDKAQLVRRLSRIEGQVRGLARMVDKDRYCIDIVTQVAAVRAALRRLEEEILRDHVAHCVEHAIASGSKADQRRKVEELMDVVSRAER
jgi:DNA-binding FrmR family transcriptional regulator